ncbi:hypothetical protein ANO14919_006880 [Xylariales sp. No.14919]|nr:hypothetical protein ANO14919_006880 [Xylariales sp. No.14919]
MPSQTTTRRASVSSFASAETLVEEERPAGPVEQPPQRRRNHKRTKTSENLARLGKRMSWNGVDSITLAKIFSNFPC